MKLDHFINKFGYPTLASLSCLSLLTSSVFLFQSSKSIHEAEKSIKEIGKWAKSQNTCIEKTFRIDGKNTMGVPSKVWSCNGGGE